MAKHKSSRGSALAIILIIAGIFIFIAQPFSVSGIGKIPYCQTPQSVDTPIDIMNSANFPAPGFILFTDGFQGTCNSKTSNGAFSCESIKPVGSSIGGTGNSFEKCALEVVIDLENERFQVGDRVVFTSTAATLPTGSAGEIVRRAPIGDAWLVRFDNGQERTISDSELIAETTPIPMPPPEETKDCIIGDVVFQIPVSETCQDSSCPAIDIDPTACPFGLDRFISFLKASELNVELGFFHAFRNASFLLSTIQRGCFFPFQ